MTFSISYLFSTLRLELSTGNRWRYSLVFFYRILIRLYFSFIEYRFVYTILLSISNSERRLTWSVGRIGDAGIGSNWNGIKAVAGTL